MRTPYYGAYGSNLNLAQMQLRCPDAIPLKSVYLYNYKLVFKSVASISPEPKGAVPMGIFIITMHCQKALDYFENFPKLYQKQYFKINLSGIKLEFMTYILDNQYGFGEPPPLYYSAIKQGYEDWNLDTSKLFNAFNTSQMLSDGTAYQSKQWGKI